MIFKKVKKDQSSEDGEVEDEKTVATIDLTTGQSKDGPGAIENVENIEKVEKIENLANILSESPVIESKNKGQQ